MNRQMRKSSHFGEILSLFMESRKLSSRDVAKIAGVSHASILDWRKGSSPTDFLAVARIADNFGVSLRFMLTGYEEYQKEIVEDSAPLSLVLGPEVFSGLCEVKIRRLIPAEQEAVDLAQNKPQG